MPDVRRQMSNTVGEETVARIAVTENENPAAAR